MVIFLMVRLWYGKTRDWIRRYGEDEWKLSSFYCERCGKRVIGLEHLVEEVRRRDRCLDGLIVVWDNEEVYRHECLRGVIEVWEDEEV